MHTNYFTAIKNQTTQNPKTFPFIKTFRLFLLLTYIGKKK